MEQPERLPYSLVHFVAWWYGFR